MEYRKGITDRWLLPRSTGEMKFFKLNTILFDDDSTRRFIIYCLNTSIDVRNPYMGFLRTHIVHNARLA